MIDGRPSEVEWCGIFHGVVFREVNNRNFIDALEAEVHCIRSGLPLSLSWRQAGRTSVSMQRGCCASQRVIGLSSVTSDLRARSQSPVGRRDQRLAGCTKDAMRSLRGRHER